MVMPAIDLTGQQFGKLTVIRRDGAFSSGALKWLCSCECGNTATCGGNELRIGKSRSCGCNKAEVNRALRTTHGFATGKGIRISEYTIWHGMKSRCENPNGKAWKNYGGRGISVAPEWRDSFEAFFEHVGPRPSNKHSIDRINNDGNYEPGNVRWATAKEQANNRRKPQRRAA